MNKSSRYRLLRYWPGKLAILWMLLSFLGCGDENAEPAIDPEFITPTLFGSESLGIEMQLPSSPGWRFQKDPPVRLGSYLTAQHESGDASLKLFVRQVTPGLTLDKLIRQRKDRLAALFGVPTLDEVIATVMRDERRTVNGSQIMQWQAITNPVARSDADEAQVVMLWQAVLGDSMAFELVGLVMKPLEASEEQLQQTEALSADVVFILQSVHFR